MTLSHETGSMDATWRTATADNVAAGPFAPTPSERHEMIAVAAYFLAERRNFAPGHADSDWIVAEQHINHMLAAMQATGRTRHDLERVGLRNALLLWAC